jgi:predicted transglutaminase-like cysteine proteinase
LDHYIKQTVAYVNEFILPIAQVKKGKYAVLKSENAEGKASAHIIYTNIAFQNIYHIKNILNEHPTELTQSGIFDPAIYRQGCFRNYLSCKLNKDNKLIYYKGVGYDRDNDEDYDLFLTTLVTNVEDDMKLTSYEWSTEKVVAKKTNTKTKTAANSSLVDVEEVGTMTIEQLKRYVDLLTVKTADN